MNTELSTITIENLSHDGRGIAHIDGKTIFVRGALPGEQVEIEITKKRSKYNEADAKNILVAAKERALPRCPHFLQCGGCHLQHMNPETQIKLHENTLREQFRHIAQIDDIPLLTAITGPEWHYRRRARLGVKNLDKKGGIIIGFREKNGRYVLDMHACSILPEKMDKLLPLLRQALNQLEGKRIIPQIEFSAGDKTTALIIRHLEPLSESDQKQLMDFAKTNAIDIYLQPGNLDTIHPLHQTAPLTYDIPHHQITLTFHPADFVQINADINRKMIDRAIEWLAPESQEHVLDLFCGIGNFSLPLTRYAKTVIGVEGSDKAILRAKENAHQNQLKNVSFFVDDLNNPAHLENWLSQPPDKVLLDPPRLGAESILKILVEIKPKAIVYVSCHPATLARDIGLLKQRGFTLQKISILDMFPHTGHFETIALLTG